ncbi:MAG: hypothetical protein Q8K26_02965, partial [Candidatus Gracilibacteria bacterium]|nr:hypothetical protein [Candidatus Gracilibacteria bacterium]
NLEFGEFIMEVLFCLQEVRFESVEHRKCKYELKIYLSPLAPLGEGLGVRVPIYYIYFPF